VKPRAKWKHWTRLDSSRMYIHILFEWKSWHQQTCWEIFRQLSHYTLSSPFLFLRLNLQNCTRRVFVWVLLLSLEKWWWFWNEMWIRCLCMYTYSTSKLRSLARDWNEMIQRKPIKTRGFQEKVLISCPRIQFKACCSKGTPQYDQLMRSRSRD